MPASLQQPFELAFCFCSPFVFARLLFQLVCADQPEYALHVRHMTRMPGRLTAKKHLSHGAQTAHSNDLPRLATPPPAAAPGCQHAVSASRADADTASQLIPAPEHSLLPAATSQEHAHPGSPGSRRRLAACRHGQGSARRGVPSSGRQRASELLSSPSPNSLRTGVALCLSTRRVTGATCIHPLPTPADLHAPCPWACSTHACSLANSCPARPARRCPPVAVCCRP